MKKLICFFYSIYIRFFAFLKRQNIRIEKSELFKLRILSNKDNSVFFRHCKCFRSSLLIEGRENSICIEGSVKNCNIKIVGTGNKLIVNDARIDKMRLVIRGKNCLVKIEKGTSIGSAFVVCMGQGNSIIVGEKCMFAESVDIWSSDSHPIYDKKGEILNKSKPIIIGNKVWLGKNVQVLKGVTIGEGTIVGMGSIVTKNLNSHSLYAGNPIRVLKESISWDKCFIEV